MTPTARIPALYQGEPVIIVGFDATDALCVFGDGHIDYLRHGDLQVVFYRDLEASYWLEYGGQYGQTEVGSDDDVQPGGAQSAADALSRDAGLSDSDVAEQGN